MPVTYDTGNYNILGQTVGGQPIPGQKKKKPSMFTGFKGVAQSGGLSGAGGPGFWDQVTVGTRLPNKTLADRFYRNALRAGYGSELAFLNRAGRNLPARSAGMLNANRLAAAQGRETVQGLMQPYQEYQQEFTEGARRFDVETALKLKQLFAQSKAQEDQKPGFWDFIGQGAGLAALALI